MTRRGFLAMLAALAVIPACEDDRSCWGGYRWGEVLR